MAPRALHPYVALAIHLGAIMSRNRYTTTPASVVDELFAVAGQRRGVLEREIGSWVGYYEDQYTRPLVDALRALPLDLEPWVQVGRQRRTAGTHSTHGFGSPAAGYAPRDGEKTPTRPLEFL